MKTFSFLFAMMLFSINLYSAPPDSCLKYFFDPDTTFFNPDSVMVDSCDSSPTFGVYYGKKDFTVMFNYNVIPRSYLAPADTIIEYTIDSIDSQYTVAIHEFAQLQNSYGNFIFREKVPNMPDTSIVVKRILYLIFEQNVPIKEVENVLRNLESVNTAYFSSWFGAISDVNDISKDNRILIHPNPVSDLILIQGLDDTKIQSFTIHNIFGQKLCESDLQEQINVSFLTPGVYFISIGNKSYKFVKY